MPATNHRLSRQSWRECPQDKQICTSNSNFAHDKWTEKIHIQIAGLPITVYFLPRAMTMTVKAGAIAEALGDICVGITNFGGTKGLPVWFISNAEPLDDETSSFSDWLQPPIALSLVGNVLWWIAANEDVHSSVPPWTTSQCRYSHLVCLNNKYRRVGWRKYHLSWS